MTRSSAPTLPLFRMHILLSVQTLVIILISINRLSTLTLGYVASNEFLRWVDFHNMLTLPLVSLVASYLLKKLLEHENPARGTLPFQALGLTFAIGVYLLGAGYGDHEVTNYMHLRFCSDDQNSDLCRIVIFNDDEFSHWVWFLGFVLMNVVLLLLQGLRPTTERAAGRDIALLVANGFFIGLGIFANLAFEEIGLDLYVVAVLAILAAVLLWRRGRQPLTIYYAVAYWLGLIGTAVYKVVSSQ
jgi:hypothetical protein